MLILLIKKIKEFNLQNKVHILGSDFMAQNALRSFLRGHLNTSEGSKSDQRLFYDLDLAK